MNYPKFKDKHKEKALFHPGDYIEYKKWDRKKMPKKYIIIYNSALLNYFKREYKPKKINLYSLITIYKYKDIGLVRMTGIGSPNATTVLEELIALGGRIFLNIGTSGGLHNEGIFLCKKALRDEGTSYHYIKTGHFIHPDKKLTKNLGAHLKKHKIDFSWGSTWTIDAPYRETKAEVTHYSKKGITNVEMEAAALFTVAKYRKVKIAAAFVVSDLLGKKWIPKFHRFDVKKALQNLLNASIEYLQK